MQLRRFISNDPGVTQHFGDPFRPLEPDCGFVQFDTPLTPSQLQQVANLIADRPDVELYVYGEASRDLNFLEYFRTLRRLHLALYKLEDVAGFAHVAGSLEELTFGRTKQTFSLRFLAAMARLKSLFLVHHKKDLSVVSSLHSMTKLGFSGISLPDLSPLLPLTSLRELFLFLGGTTNLAVVRQLASLEHVWLMRIPKLSDLDVLGDLIGLRKLQLDGMRNVTTLPSFGRHARLEDVTLDTMKGLTDLSPVAAAPGLRRLTVAGMPQLSSESFRCLLGHPRLEELWADTGKRKLNDAVKSMFGAIVR